jgi:predicted MFS family arabinose efflux permease
LDLRSSAALIGLLLIGLVDNQILSPVLRDIAESFEVSIGRVGTTVSGYALAAATAALVVGPLSDRSGRRKFLVGAGLTFCGGSILAYVSSLFGLFAVARVVSGASAGVISALVVATIADRVPYERRGRAMGWVASAYFAAPIIFVPAAAWLADISSWRVIYITFAAAALILAGSVGSWVQDILPKGKKSTSSPISGYAKFFQGRSTAAGALSAFFVSGGITGFVLYLGAYLGERYGLSVTQIGLVFLLSGAASLAGAVGAGPLSDRVGKRSMAIVGCMTLSVFVLVVPFVEGGVPLYVLLGLVGLAAASRVAPLQSLVTELVPQESRGAYIALRNTLSQLGIAASAAVGAFLYARGGYDFVCYWAAALSVMAALLLLMVNEPLQTKGDSN